MARESDTTSGRLRSIAGPPLACGPSQERVPQRTSTVRPAVVRIASRAMPDPTRAAVYDRGFPIYRDIQAALAPLNHRIHDFVKGGS